MIGKAQGALSLVFLIYMGKSSDGRLFVCQEIGELLEKRSDFSKSFYLTDVT